MQRDLLSHKANSIWRRAYRWLEMIAEHIDRHDLLRFSASIAYTTALSIAPFVLVALSLVAFLDLNIQGEILNYLKGFIGADASRTFEIIISSAPATRLSTVSGIIGFAVLAFSASAMFSNLRASLDRIAFSETPPQPFHVLTFIKQRLLEIFWVFAFIAILVFSIFLSMIMQHFKAISFLLNFGLFVLVFTLLYRFVPTTKVSWSRCLVSGAISSVCFIIGKYVIGIYLSHAFVSNSVGALGTVIVFLIWVYYVSLITLVSYECTNAFYIRAHHRATIKASDLPKHH